MSEIAQKIDEIKKSYIQLKNSPTGAQLDKLIHELQEIIHFEMGFANPVTAKYIECPNCHEKIFFKIEKNQ